MSALVHRTPLATPSMPTSTGGSTTSWAPLTGLPAGEVSVMVIASVEVPDAVTDGAETVIAREFSWLTAKSACAMAPALTVTSVEVGAYVALPPVVTLSGRTR